MTFGKFARAATVVATVALVWSTIESRELSSPDSDSYLGRNVAAHAAVALDQVIGESWPKEFGMQMTGVINASFTCYGQLGLGLYEGEIDQPYASFETPPGEGIEYLYAGAVWVGGVVGRDTLVSVGADGWHTSGELLPTSRQGTVFRFPYTSDCSMVAEFADTAAVSDIDIIDGRPHRSLGLRILNRSHAFGSSPANNCIFYDMAITNVGDKFIQSGYVGLYFDGDAGPRSNQNAAQDDNTGTLADGTAYIIDNDGDPQSGEFLCPKVFAAKVISTSIPGTQVSFNWWISNANAHMDFGPQTRAKFRDLGTGGMGTPEGDRNKYAYLSNGEWDYDQVMTGTIAPDDPIWVYPQQDIVLPFSRGLDTRFLLSVGPFNLDPESTVFIRYITCTGDAVHQDTANWRTNLQMNYRPETYLSNLNFADLLDNVQTAELIAPSLFSEYNPPSGFRVSRVDSLAVGLQWDTTFNQGMNDYSIYAAEIPDSAYEHAGTPPPWYQPTTWTKVAETGMVDSCSVTGLSPCKWYVFASAVRYDGGEGSLGSPPVFGKLKSSLAITLEDSLLFTVNGVSPVLKWSASSAGTYRIYKFPDSVTARSPYLPFYSKESVEGTLLPVDTVVRGTQTYYYYALTPYVELPGDLTNWTDPSWSAGALYRITSVDSCGFESPFSPLIRSIDATRSKDILIIYGSQAFAKPEDSLIAFYRDILGSRYEYDLYDFMDSIAGACGGVCLDWHDFMRYRLIIADGGLDESILDLTFGNPDYYGAVPLGNYLMSGGKLAYCGTLNSRNVLSTKFMLNEFGVREVLPTARQFFDIDSVCYASARYYSFIGLTSFSDTLFGFRRAVSEKPELSDLVYDTNTVLPAWLLGHYESKTAPGVATFRVQDSSRILFRYRSLFPDKSWCEDQPVGVVTEGDGFQTYLFGFHLWYMERSGAGQLIDWIMNHQPTGVEPSKSDQLPTQFRLGQNYPNPFNPSTTVRFHLPKRAQVSLEIFNILGQHVVTLVDSRLAAGEHTATWDGKGKDGRFVSSGIYLYRLRADEFVQVKKMVLVK